MLRNIPGPEDFALLSVQYLAQAIDHILNTEKHFGDFTLSDTEYTDEPWEHHQGILGNSLIMLFLSIENYLKSEICKVSPLLLISNEPSKWGVKNVDKDFEDQFFHPFDDLIVIYQEIKGVAFDAGLKADFEVLRKKRNKCVHGIQREKMTPQYVLDAMRIFLVNIWGTSWLQSFREILLTEDFYGLDSKDCEDLKILEYFTLFEKYFSEDEFRTLIGMPLVGRRFFCPECETKEIEAGLNYDANYALHNHANQEVDCYLCTLSTSITYQKCVSRECQCDIICLSEDSIALELDTCLHCWQDQT